MINFYNTLKTGFQFILILLTFLTNSNKLSAQTGGTDYFNNDIIELEIDGNICPNAPDWTIQLQNFNLNAPICAEQDGIISFDLVSNYVMEDIVISASYASGIDLPSSDIYEYGYQDYNFSTATENDLTLSCTTNEFDSEGNSNPIFGDSYVIEIKVTNEFCSYTTFVIPVGTSLCSDENVCVDISDETKFNFSVPSDYDPIVVDYYLEMPTCANADAKFVLNSIVGGGCADNSASFFTNVAGEPQVPINPLDTLFIDVIDGEQFTITTVCTANDISQWCTKTYIETVEIIDFFEVTSEVLQVSCAGGDDGNISVNIVNTETNEPLLNATYSWEMFDPDSDDFEDLSSDNNQEILNNPYGITGQGGQLNNLIGSPEGILYQVLIIDDQDCPLNDGEPYQFVIYEPEPLEIASDYIIHDWKCEEGIDLTCFGDDDAQITLQLPEIIIGGNFSSTVLNSDNPSDSISIPDNSDYNNYYFQLFSGSNPDPIDDSPIWGPVNANNNNSNIIIDIPLSEGTYTLALYSPSGVDADFDGVGDDPPCFTTEIIEIVGPEQIQLSLNADDSNNLCYGDTNGLVDLNITGGCPAEECEDNDSVFFPLDCGQAVGFFGCGDSPYGDVSILCPETCNNCPDLINGYEVFIEDENGNDINSLTNLPAGTYTVYALDSFGCSSNTQTFTITEPDPIELIEDIDGDGIINAENVISISEYNCFDENSIPYNISCFGASDGSISIDINSINQLNGGPFTYQLYSGNNLINSADNSDATGGIVTFDDLSAQDYTLEIWNLNYTVNQGENCMSSTILSLIQPNEITINEVTAVEKECGYNVSCFGANDGVVNVDASGGCNVFSYEWDQVIRDDAGNIINYIQVNNPLGLNSPTLENIGAGEYRVTVDDGTCGEIEFITLTEPDEIIVTTSQNDVSCFGGSDGEVTINITGGCANGLISEINNYSIEWIDENGESLDVTPNTEESFGVVTSSISGLSEGYYEVHITDANGCVNNDTNFTINEPDQALFVTEELGNYNGFGISCYSANNGYISIELSGGTPPYTVTWSNNNGDSIINVQETNNEILQNLTPGTYTVEVNDQLDCPFTIDNMVITEPPPMAISETHSDYNGFGVSCFGETDGFIDVTVTGGTGIYTYSWSNGATTEDLNDIGAGTYTLTALDENGCPINIEVTLEEPEDEININVSQSDYNSYGVSCFGAEDGFINISITGGTESYSFLWSNGATTEDLNDIGVGTYTITVTDTNNCSKTSTIEITEPEPLELSETHSNYNGYGVSCFGSTNGFIDITVTGGTGNYTYSWTSGQNTEDLNDIGSGNYNLIVVDENGCEQDITVEITEPDELTASNDGSIAITSDFNGFNISCHGANDGSIDLELTGGVGEYIFNWTGPNNFTSNSQNIQNLEPGTYYYDITDENNCSILNNSVEITEPEPIELSETHSDYSGFGVSCFGYEDGSIDLTVAGGTSVYTYDWSNGATSEDLSDIGAGTYTVIVTDENGCFEEITVEITEPEGMELEGQVSNYCNFGISCCEGSDGFIDLSGAGGAGNYSYSWSSGQTTEDLNNIGAGIYTVTVTDSNGCSQSEEFEIIAPECTEAELLDTEWKCNGEEAKITVVLNGGLECNTSFSYTLYSPDGSVATVGVSDDQNPGTTLTGNNITFSDLAGGQSGDIYNLEYISDYGCINYLEIDLQQPNVLEVETIVSEYECGNNISCNGANDATIELVFPVSQSNIEITWSSFPTGQVSADQANSPIITNLAPGVYFYTVEDIGSEFGCDESAQIEITEPDPIILSETHSDYNGFNVSCNGALDGSIDLTVSGGADCESYTYEWSNGVTTEDLNNIGAGTYTVTLTDQNGCAEEITVEITEPEEINVSHITSDFSGYGVSCNGATDGSIDVTVTGGTGNYSYSWSNGSNLEDLNNLGAGTYTLTVTDDNGCFEEINVEITETEELIVTETHSNNSGYGVSCFGECNGSINISVSGGTGVYTYDWTGVTWAGPNTQDLSNLCTGIYSVIVSDENGCSDFIEVEITEPEPIELSETHSDYSGFGVSCFGYEDGSIDLTVAGGTSVYTYDWSNGATSEDLSDIGAGTYTVIVTDENGCFEEITVEITEPEGMELTETHSDYNGYGVSCNGATDGSIDVTVTGGAGNYTYNWSSGQTTEDLNDIGAGTYTLTVTDENDCEQDITVEITETELLEISSTNTINVNCSGEPTGEIDITVNGGNGIYIYNWSNGATTEDITGLTVGSYTVIINDEYCLPIEQTFEIVENDDIVVNIDSYFNPSGCNGNNGFINLTVNGGTPPYSLIYNNSSPITDNSGSFNISNLAEGNYNITVTDFFNCEPVEISQELIADDPVTAIETISNVTWYQGNDGSIDLVVNGGTAPYEFLWSNGLTTEDIDNLIAGTYSVTITDQNNCQENYEFEVTEPEFLFVDLSSDPTNCGDYEISCNGEETGNININVGGGTPFFDTDGNPYYEYEWTQALQNGDPQNGIIYAGILENALINLQSGTYSIIISDANSNSNNQIAEASIILDEPEALIFSNINTEDVDCFGNSNGLIEVEINGGCGNYIFDWTSNNGFSSNQSNISNLEVGVYTLNVTDENECQIDTVLFISQPNDIELSSFEISDYNGFGVTCNGATDGFININIAGGSPFIDDDGVPFYNYSWSNGSTSQNISNIGAGIYTLTITDSSNCPQNFDLEIFEPEPITSLCNSTQATSCLSNGTVSVDVFGGVPPYEFIWYSDNNDNGLYDLNIDELIDNNNVPSGTYNVQITDSNNCQLDTNCTVDQSDDPIVTVTSFNDLEGPNCSGQASVVLNGGGCDEGSFDEVEPAPFGYLTWYEDIDGDGIGDGNPIGYGDQNPINLQSGNYTAVVQDICGCSTEEAFTIESFDEILINSETSVDIYNGFAVSCCGAEDGFVNIQVSGGSQTSASGCNMYTVEWFEDLNGNGALDFNENIISTQTGGTPINQGGNMIYEYEIDNLNPGTYSVIVTDCTITQCPIVETFNLLQEPTCIEITDLFIYNMDCDTEPVIPSNAELEVIGGTGNYSYSWENNVTGQVVGIAESVSNIPPGEYTVTVTDENSQFNDCEAQSTFIIENVIGFDYLNNGELNVDIILSDFSYGNNIPCFGGTASVEDFILYSNGNPIYEEDGIYEINWGEINPESIGAGTYSISVTNITLDPTCTSLPIQFTVNQPDELEVVVPDISTCNSCPGIATATINGGTPPYSDTWINTATGEEITEQDENELNGFGIGENGFINILNPGSYEVIITDYNGCTDSWEFNVLSEPESINWASINTTDTCVPDNCDGSAELEIDFDANQDDSTYIPYWFNCSGESMMDNVNQDNPFLIENLCPGEYSCQFFDAVSNEIHTLCFEIDPGSFDINFDITDVKCYGENNGAINITPSGGTPNYSYLWSNGAITEDIENLAPGEYIVTVTDQLGCIVQESVTVNEPSSLEIDYQIQPLECGEWDVSCLNACDGSIRIDVGGGVPPYDYVLIQNDLEISGSFDSEVIVDGICEGEWIFAVYDASGCSNTNENINLKFEAPPEMVIEYWINNEISCYEESEGNNQDGSISVSVNGGTPFTFGPDQIENTSDDEMYYSFNWEDSNGFLSNSQNITNLISDYYTLNVNDCNQNIDCIVSEFILLEPPIDLQLECSQINPSCVDANNGSISLTVTGGNSIGLEYFYSINGADYLPFETEGNEFIIENLEIGEYDIIVKDIKGCEESCYIILETYNEECLEVPTLITPNGDRYNDLWEIENIDNFYPNAQIKIHNRWGQLIYEHNEGNYYDNMWDGTHEGENLPIGAYYFIINCNDESNKKLHGAVLIKR